jgi:hypothetical protein
MRIPEEMLATIEMSWIRRLRPGLNRHGILPVKPVYLCPSRGRGNHRNANYEPKIRRMFRFVSADLIFR